VENAQSALIDQLSQVLDIRVDANPDGGVYVRTSGGAPLVGAQASQISYTPNGGSYTTHGVITLNAQNGSSTNLEPYVLSGQLKGLLQARDQDLPALAEALGGFAGALADNLNAVHNENASTPAVGDLTGRDTGLLSTDGLNFTGKATIGVVDSSGALQQKLSVDFGSGAGGTITGSNPAATYAFSNTIGSFHHRAQFSAWRCDASRHGVIYQRRDVAECRLRRRARRAAGTRQRRAPAPAAASPIFSV